MMNKDREIKNYLIKYYEIDLNDKTNILNISSKSYKLNYNDEKKYFLKNTHYNALEKYHFLYNQGVNNVLYPLLNKENNYVSRLNTKAFYINNYFENNLIKKEVRINNLITNLNNLHEATSYKKQLETSTSRPKFEEITNRLDHHFRIIEDYVRKIEIEELKPYSMHILSNYQYILNAKSELIKLQKNIISNIKAKESINYSFIHNNPKLDHLLNIKGYNYLTSIENGKIGIRSLDYAKLYVEADDINIDYKSIIQELLKKENNQFEYDYFRFLVLIIYIKKINLTNNDYLNSIMFVNISSNIKKYFENFSD